MGNPAHSRTFNLTGTAVGNTSDASFPAANLGDWWHPYRPHKTSGAYAVGTSYSGWTWGSAQPLVGLYVDDINLDAVLVQSKDSGSSWTTRYAVGVPLCPLTGKRKGYLTLESWNYYGLRLLGASSATSDGASQMRTGSLIPVTSVSTWGSPITPEYGEDIDRGSIANDDFLSGGAEPLVVGNYRAELILNVQFGAAALLRDNLLELKRMKPLYFLLVQDISAALGAMTEKAWICRQVTSPALRYPYNNAGLTMQQLVLREAA